MLLSELLERLENEPQNGELRFKIAEAMIAKNEGGKARQQIQRGLELEAAANPFYKITEVKVDGKTVVLLTEKSNLALCLDGFTYYSNLLHSLLEYLISIGMFQIVLSMKSVSYYADCGPGLFLDVQRSARNRNGDLILVEVQPMVKKVMELLGEQYQIYDTIDEAVDNFGLLPMRLFRKIVHRFQINTGH